MAVRSVSSISPVSIPSSISIVVTPVSVSPEYIAHCMGEAPLCLGSNEACAFTQPYRGMESISGGSILPYATTIIISGASSLIILMTSGFLTDCG